jgi:hypothetical protein
MYHLIYTLRAASLSGQISEWPARVPRQTRLENHTSSRQVEQRSKVGQPSLRKPPGRKGS